MRSTNQSSPGTRGANAYSSRRSASTPSNTAAYGDHHHRTNHTEQIHQPPLPHPSKSARFNQLVNEVDHRRSVEASKQTLFVERIHRLRHLAKDIELDDWIYATKHLHPGDYRLQGGGGNGYMGGIGSIKGNAEVVEDGMYSYSSTAVFAGWNAPVSSLSHFAIDNDDRKISYDHSHHLNEEEGVVMDMDGSALHDEGVSVTNTSMHA